jgi:sugar O-acyltransferase (sialic acid O-acetyltransferase NeuD family)
LNKLLLIGAGGFGRDVAGMVQHGNQTVPAWDLVGFLDDNDRLWGALIDGVPVLGGLDVASAYPDAYLVCCVADPLAREGLVARASQERHRWATVIHPTAVVLSSASVGEGCIICPHSAVKAGAVLGAHVHVNSHCSIGHEAELADFVTLSPQAVITGQAKLGIGAFVGASATVLPRVTVGTHAVIGAGAVAIHDVAARTTVVGVPAHPLQRRPPITAAPDEAPE